MHWECFVTGPSSFRSAIGSLASAAAGLGGQPPTQSVSGPLDKRTEAVARQALASYNVRVLGVDVLATYAREARPLNRALLSEAQRSLEGTARLVSHRASAMFAGAASRIEASSLVEGIASWRRRLPASASKSEVAAMASQLQGLAERLGDFVQAHAPLNPEEQSQVLAAAQQLEGAWAWALQHSALPNLYKVIQYITP